MFSVRNIGKTLVTGTRGAKIAPGVLKGRVFEVSLADPRNEEVAFRNFEPITEDVQGENCPISMARVLPVTKCAPWSTNGRP